MIDINNFDAGLRVLEDSTKAPIGSARTFYNMMLSDRGGLTKRPGTLLIGTKNTTGGGTQSLYNYKTSGEVREIPIKAYDTYLEYYHPDLLDWYRLEGSFTSGQDFGFREHLVNTDNEDYLYFCNRTEDYRRWPGAITQLNGALAGGETTVTVDTTLKSPVYATGTATSVTTTTIDVAGTPWAASQWNGFYVLITSGAQSGKIGLISATTSSQITFATIAGLSGTPTFAIRQIMFPASGTLVIDTEELAYSAVPSSTTISTSAVVSAHSDNAAVTVKPTAYPANPRGNRLANHYTRMIVGNVRSGLSRNSSGTLQGSQSSGSYYVSKIRDAADFTFSATRVAGEGDVVSVAFGGGDITDVIELEDKFAVFKPNYIEVASYSQDANDLIARQQLKSGYGAIGRVVKGKNDVYFVTENNEITSLGRVAMKDITLQALNIGYPVKRLLEEKDFSRTRGMEYQERILLAYQDDTDTNNRVLIYNQDKLTFEGVWALPANDFMLYNELPHYASSQGANVYQMFVGTDDVEGANSFGVTSYWKSNWMNLTPQSKFDDQSVRAYGAEGYIMGGTEITFQLFKDFSDTATLEFTFGGTEEEFLDGNGIGDFLGGLPLGVTIEGSLDDPDDEGWRHFQFVVWFPDIYSIYFSLGIANEGKNQNFEVTRLGLEVLADPLANTTRVKTL